MPKPFIFVLMPFAKEFDDIYQVGIKPACKESSAYCERVDEQIFEESILERIYNQILKADIIIADMTDRNPNVFYETGYAHALGKQVILLTQKGEDIPFDLKQYPHIVYEGKISILKDELKRRLKWFLENPRRPYANLGLDLEYFLKGEKLVHGLTASFQVVAQSGGVHIFHFLLDAHNPCNKACDASGIELGLILPLDFENSISGNSVRLPGKLCMHLLNKMGRILPGGWKPLPLDIKVKSFEVIRGNIYNCALRIFSEIGIKDTPFRMKII